MEHKKVLIIDDEADIRFILNEVIMETGCKCIQAENAMEGIEACAKEKPDLIFLDIQMPKMNGLDAIKRIRAIDKDVPVIMLSAFSHMEDVIMNLGVNVTDFISKPFDLDLISQKIKDTIGE